MGRGQAGPWRLEASSPSVACLLAGVINKRPFGLRRVHFGRRRDILGLECLTQVWEFKLNHHHCLLGEPNTGYFPFRRK